MNAKIFRLRLITNLHMGSGETNFNFIDNQVQRDPITAYPNMHSSGIKGALREFFYYNSGKEFTVNIFGSENGDNNNGSNSQQGALSFIEGKLLALPVRSNKKSYFMGTTKEILEEYINFTNIFGKDTKLNLDKINISENEVLVIEDKIDNLMIEGIEGKQVKFLPELKEKFKEVFGLDDVAIFSEKFFKNEVAKKLPVIARNFLDNGVSKNLWYEEVVPRESVFYTGIVNTQNKKVEFDKFTEELEKNLIQIGGNATIGYGFTKFVEVK